MALPGQDAWAGQGVVLVGGGPSLKGFDWSILPRWLAKTHTRCIVVNRAFKDVPNADIWFSEDDRVLDLWCNTPEWNQFQGLKLFHALEPVKAEKAFNLCEDINVIYRTKRLGNKYWSDRWSDGLSYSSNSMIGALNVASILGCNPIYLLGVDCNADATDANYHQDYDMAREKDPSWGKAVGHQLLSFASDFEHWAAPNLRNRGRHVINLNPDSGVKCWPRVDWKEVVR